MVLGNIFAASLLVSFIYSVILGRGGAVTAALLEGASSGITLAVAISGPLCLWSGIAALMERVGFMGILSKFLSPILHFLFPSSKNDQILAQNLSANVCANLLGLGNAATPMGIQAAGRLRDPNAPDKATDELCRLVVMNTASIQLLPTTVAAVRQSAGAATPMEILPCVWISSVLSVSAGLVAAGLLRRFWKDA